MKTLCLSRMRAEALGGYPVRSKDGATVRLAVPEELIPTDEPEVYILDELTSASEDVLAAAQELLLARRLGGRVYPQIYPVGICNPPEIAANGVALPLPLLNRVATYTATVRDWLAWAAGAESPIRQVVAKFRALDLPLLIVGPPGVGKSAAIEDDKGAEAECRRVLKSSSVLAYLEEFPDQALVMPKDDSTCAWASPRSWTRAAFALASDPRFPIDMIVGDTAAASFREYRGAYSVPLEDMSEAERIDRAARACLGISSLDKYDDKEWVRAEPARIEAVAATMRELQ